MTDRRHEDRDALRALQARWEEDIRTLTPGMGETDRYSIQRAMLEDLICDVQGEIDDLTDDIGDERGDDYAVERSMHQFRSI